MTLRLSDRVSHIERTLIRTFFERAPADAINLGLGEPDWKTAPEISIAGIGGIAAGYTGYSSTAGDPALRKEIATLYPSCGEDGSRVLVTCGSQQALFAALLTLVDAGGDVLIPDPGYPGYSNAVKLIGARPRGYTLSAERGFELDASAIEHALTPETQLVILNAPANPTGRNYPRSALADVVKMLGARGIPWLSDEVYARLTFDESFVSPFELDPESGVVISGLSKDMCMTGWRLGWLVAPEAVIRKATAVHQQMVTCASNISQQAARAAFTPAGARALERWKMTLAERRDCMMRALLEIPNISFARPEGAFYFFVDVRRYGDSMQIAQRLLDEQKVISIPGIAFGAGGEGYLRLSFAAAESSIERGVAGLRSVLSGG
jgi:aspartate aminotransferase